MLPKVFQSRAGRSAAWRRLFELPEDLNRCRLSMKSNPLGECRFNSKNIGRRMCLRAENRGKDKGHSTLIDPLCFVEAGDYPIGGENHTAFVQQFLIGRTPVTNRQYLDYLEATQHSDSLRSDLGLSEILGDLPAVDLSWHE